jgi:hypothetical protein
VKRPTRRAQSLPRRAQSLPRRAQSLPRRAQSLPRRAQQPRDRKPKRPKKKKKKKDSGPPLEPGNRNKTSTFLPQGWQLEGQCAAYLGFTQIQHLCMFAISPIVLDAFVEGHGDLTPAKHSKVLEILRDCRDFDDIMEGTSNVPRLDFKEPLVFPKLGPFLDLKEDDLEPIIDRTSLSDTLPTARSHLGRSGLAPTNGTDG